MLLFIEPKQFLPVVDRKLLEVYFIWPNLFFITSS